MTSDELAEITEAASPKPVSSWGRETLLEAARIKNSAAKQPATKPASPAKRKAAKKA